MKLKPVFFVKFEPDTDKQGLDEQAQSYFLQQVGKFADDNKMKARMLDEKETKELKPGANIVITLTGSLSPLEYSEIIDSFVKVINKSYPKLIMEREKVDDDSSSDDESKDKEATE